MCCERRLPETCHDAVAKANFASSTTTSWELIASASFGLTPRSAYPSDDHLCASQLDTGDSNNAHFFTARRSPSKAHILQQRCEVLRMHF